MANEAGSGGADSASSAPNEAPAVRSTIFPPALGSASASAEPAALYRSLDGFCGRLATLLGGQAAEPSPFKLSDLPWLQASSEASESRTRAPSQVSTGSADGSTSASGKRTAGGKQAKRRNGEKRKEQNRNAQRAFRARKEQRLAEMEVRMQAVEAEAKQIEHENADLRGIIRQLVQQNRYLSEIQSATDSDSTARPLPPARLSAPKTSTTPAPKAALGRLDFSALVRSHNQNAQLSSDTASSAAAIEGPSATLEDIRRSFSITSDLTAGSAAPSSAQTAQEGSIPSTVLTTPASSVHPAAFESSSILPDSLSSLAFPPNGFDGQALMGAEDPAGWAPAISSPAARFDVGLPEIDIAYDQFLVPEPTTDQDECHGFEFLNGWSTEGMSLVVETEVLEERSLTMDCDRTGPLT